MHLENDQDLIPAFRAGPRDRFSVGLSGHWMAADRVLLDLGWDVSSDRHPDGHRITGPGDIELGAMVRLPIAEAARTAARRAGGLGPSFGLGWRVKLPNAADEGELGSDETDLCVLAAAAADLGPLRVWAGGGLAILGDPTMLAAQDDVGFVQAGIGWDAPGQLDQGWLPRADLDLGLALPSASNPLRSELGGRLAWGRRWSVGLDGAVGLSAASPTVRMGLSLEHRFLADFPGDGTSDRR